MKQVAPSLAACLLTLLVGATSCSSKQESAAGGPPGAQQQQVKDYPVLTLTPQTAVLHTDYPTVLEGQANVEIRPKVDGFIDQVLVDEGARVRKGQLLFRLNSDESDQQVRSAQASVLSAQADVTAAQLDVQKTQPLVEQNILSNYQLQAYQATLQSRRAALAQARATLQNAQKTQSYTRISSPADGVIGTLPYKLGSLVNSSLAEPLTTVASIGTVRAYFSINEKDALAFSQATPGTTSKERLSKLPSVQLVLSDGSVYAQPGRVEAASGLVNTQTGSVTVRASFPNPAGVLRSGATGLVRLPQQVPSALVVPQSATYELQGKHFAYVVGPDNKVKNTEIQVQALPDGRRYVVREGLQAGDQIVTEGVSALQDGQAIKPRPAMPDTTASASPR
ncbi:efflux RND transporter periplasmic adaptor subunit [Hymenobacter mucosus]|uniref:Membrane fusion protein, multidrug efflux system n=1 Tax=Hymenobacter mucosus TaxID=1411120 RepID=A0A238ZBT3_9BACT|nr:efflux RND transporter periplasmic adaptor subunit [Hymenobacter mucosus]SNR80448.1 membrane fusion protein, multidrug efflux system [Hymenobacter mucosus]